MLTRQLVAPHVTACYRLSCPHRYKYPEGKLMGTRMTSKETAVYVGASESTLRYWRACDEGPRSYRIGRRTFYDIEDVDAWIEAQKAATSRGGAA